MSSTKVILLHGWQESSGSFWLPELKKWFEGKGAKVFVPDLPGNYFPQKDKWIKIIEGFKPDNNTIIIGHSLGGVAGLRYLENAGQSIRQIILVASPIDTMKFEGLSNFFVPPFDWPKIKTKASKINLLYEDEDPVVPLEHGQFYSKNLECPLDVIHGCLHLQKFDLSVIKKIIAL